jgi:hypothetical protein
MSINYYFDLDNTLCYTVGNDYANSIPIQERIDYVNSLKELGHSITIWTARGKASNTDHTQLTTRQLQDWNIKYDLIPVSYFIAFSVHFDVLTRRREDESKGIFFDLFSARFGNKLVPTLPD